MLASRSWLITHRAGQPRLAALGCPFQRKGLAGRASGKSYTSIALYKTHGASKFDAPYLHSSLLTPNSSLETMYYMEIDQHP